MRFLLADTFTASLAKLTNAEQKAVKLTAFDLQTDPRSPGLRWHKLPGLRDDRFRSVSASMDLRLIVHDSGQSRLLCYVDHHDAAYAWAGRRRLETHPRTGAAQLVEVVEKTVEEAAEAADPSKPADRGPEVPEASTVRGSEGSDAAYGGPALGGVSEERLLGFGVPADWLAEVRAASEERLLVIAERLPGEAQEAILRLLVGEEPEPAAVVAEEDADPFRHPDAERRFKVVADSEDLQRALDAPWEKWAVFLHPSQKALVEKRFGGPARVAGSAGTGKTVVALHRAAALARRDTAAGVLLTTFSRPLARLLRARLRRLVEGDAALAGRIEVETLDDAVLGLHESQSGRPRLATPEMQRALVSKATKAVPDHRFSPAYAFEEWRAVVDAWQLSSWEDYRDVARLGRRTRLGEKQRRSLWNIFHQVRAGLESGGLVTMAGVYAEATAHPDTAGH